MLTLAIVGRPNVGKSTLFNRLAGKQLAIIDDTPGVTRDWREAEGYLFDRKIRIIDTAGLEEAFDETIEGRMRRQTEYALEKADAVLFLVDGRSGITPLDEHFAGWLRRRQVPVILGVNKCESDNAVQAGLAEAYRLGLGEPLPLSAAHGHGMDDLYHMLKPYFPASDEDENENDERGLYLSDEELDALEGQENFDFTAIVPAGADDDPEKPIKIAIVGRPNVGKSTLLNSLLGEQRVMTGPEAGITRDAIAVDWTHKERKIRLVDTAGMRRKAKITNRLEKMAVEDSIRAIRLAQVVIMVMDAESMLEKQDLQIAEHVIKEGRALILAINKWDLIKNRKETLEEMNYRLETSLAQIRDIPTVTLSALHGKNTEKLMDSVLDIYNVWNRRTPTGPLNRWLAGAESHNPPPLVQGRPNRLKYITQIKSRPPTFALWISRPKDLPASYKRYLMNGIRKDFNLPGIPIRLLVRASKNPYK